MNLTGFYLCLSWLHKSSSLRFLWNGEKIRVGDTFRQIPGLTENDLMLPEVFPFAFPKVETCLFNHESPAYWQMWKLEASLKDKDSE